MVRMENPQLIFLEREKTMNKVILCGNLSQEIELKQTTNGKSVVTNCIGVKREYKNDKGEYESDFISLVIWGAQAEYLSKYAHKGDRVELVGRWTVRKYTANDGTTRTVNECVVESIKAFSKQPKQESQAPSFNYTQPNFEEIKDDQDLPF
jgi:single-strand DNA-binding protein